MRSVETGITGTAQEHPAATITSVSIVNLQTTLVRSAPTVERGQPELAARSILSDFAVAAHSRGVVEDMESSRDGRAEWEKVCSSGGESSLPKYMRGLGWRVGKLSCGSRTIAYTLIDSPLPRPPAHKCENKAVMDTIKNHPDLFQIPMVQATCTGCLD